MKEIFRLLPQPSMAWRWMAGMGAWMLLVALVGWAADSPVRGEADGFLRLALSPALLQPVAQTGLIWAAGLVLGGCLALALAMLSSRRWCRVVVLPVCALEFASLLPAWLLPWWLARESLDRRLPLTDLWRSWGIADDEIGAGWMDPAGWMMVMLVAMVVAGITVGRMRHALLRSKQRLIEAAPLRARGLKSGSLEYRHRLGGAAPAVIHAMRDALPWSLFMLLYAGLLLRGPGAVGLLVGGHSGSGAGVGSTLAAWLWLGWGWCTLTTVGAWAERLAGGVSMVVASLGRAHGTLLGVESGRWAIVGWLLGFGLPLAGVGWLAWGGLSAKVALSALAMVWLGWAVSVYLVSGRSTRFGLWLAYLGRGGGHWPWWAAAVLWVWGLGMPWWQGLIFPLPGLVLEGSSRARQLASFWIRAGGVREAAIGMGIPLNQFRWRSLLPGLGLAMLPWMLGRVALFLFGAFALQSVVWLPDQLGQVREWRLDGVRVLFPLGLESVWNWGWRLAPLLLVLRLVARLWERVRWNLARRRLAAPDSVVLAQRGGEG